MGGRGVASACGWLRHGAILRVPAAHLRAHLLNAALFSPCSCPHPHLPPRSSLYPNVDFYSGIVLRALGIPVEMYTVLFAMARTVGWVAQVSATSCLSSRTAPWSVWMWLALRRAPRSWLGAGRPWSVAGVCARCVHHAAAAADFAHAPRSQRGTPAHAPPHPPPQPILSRSGRRWLRMPRAASRARARSTLASCAASSSLCTSASCRAASRVRS